MGEAGTIIQCPKLLEKRVYIYIYIYIYKQIISKLSSRQVLLPGSRECWICTSTVPPAPRPASIACASTAARRIGAKIIIKICYVHCILFYTCRRLLQHGAPRPEQALSYYIILYYNHNCIPISELQTLRFEGWFKSPKTCIHQWSGTLHLLLICLLRSSDRHCCYFVCNDVKHTLIQSLGLH